MSHITRKPVFGGGGCDQVRLKPACSASEASKNLEILGIMPVVIIQESNNKDADQTAQADLRLCCSIWRKTDFLMT